MRLSVADYFVVEEFKILSSTSDYLKSVEDSAPHLIIAAGQTKGRGTKGKTFVSEMNKGLFFSFNIKEIDRDCSALVKISSVALKTALAKLYGVKLEIKWINDLLYAKKKLAGILVEKVYFGNVVTKTIIGIGLNLYYYEYPSDLATKMISLDEIITGFTKKAILEEFFTWFFYFLQNESLALTIYDREVITKEEML